MKDIMIKKYDAIIEFILNKMNCDFTKKTKYYICQNPISKSVGNPDKKWSAAWYRNSGELRIFNGDQINNKDILTIEEVVSYFKIREEYEEIIGSKIDFVESFFSKYDMKLCKKISKETVKISEEVPKNMIPKIKDYMKKRKWNLSNKVVPAKSLFISEDKKEFETPGIIFLYPCGFRKFRSATKNKFYKAIGIYNSFYEAKVKKEIDKVILIEGEGESESIKKYVNCDVLGMHNVKSIPQNLDQLKKYKKILILLDIDEFDKFYRIIYNTIKEFCPDAEIRIRPKLYILFNSKIVNKIDYNDLDKNNMITKEVILKGYLHYNDFKGKKGFEDNYSIEDIKDKVEKPEALKDYQNFEDFVLI